MSDWNLSFLRPSGEDYLRWKNIVYSMSPEKIDIHFSPDYARIYELTYGHEAFLAVYGDQDNFIITPFIRNDVTKLPFMESQHDQPPAYDIESLYGYGGPMAHVSENSSGLLKELYTNYFKTFHEFCLANHIVDEYIRLHPLLANHLPIQEFGLANLSLIKPIAYVDLTRDEETLWHGLRKGHRASVNKARRLGVQVVREQVADEALAVFRHLYKETMERKQAIEEWLFPDSYFTNCADCLGDQRISIFSAKVDGVTAASSLIIHAYQTVYYHFAGSSNVYRDYCANNLLLYEVTLWAKARGYRYFHLGGGFVAGDNLYFFKSGFSNTTAWLYAYKQVHDEKRYTQLCELKNAWDLAQGIQRCDSLFFPSYRS